MSNISDKDIDRLFKQAAESYEAPFEEDMWSQMDAKLIAGDGGSGLTFYNVVGGVIAGIIISIALLFFVGSLGNHDENSSQPQALSNAEINRDSIHINQTQAQFENESQPQQVGRSVKHKADNIRENANLSPSNQATNSNEVANNRTIPTNGRTSRSNKLIQGKDNHDRDEFVKELSPEPTAEKEENYNTLFKPNTDKNLYADFLKGISVATGYNEVQVVRDFITFKNEEIEEQEKEPDFRPYFAVKAIYAPDLSSVGYYAPDKPGHDYGLLGEYNFSNKWVVSMGAIVAHKIYYTNDDVGEAYGSYKYPVDKLDGECKVIDIPINASYFLFRNEKQGFYVSLGISSYLMLSEDYKFEYSNYYGSWEWEESYKGENKHLFGLVNASVGYERQLKGNLFFQIEPFLKAPLVGIGAGKIDLVSTGAFINLKYQFKNKPKD